MKRRCPLLRRKFIRVPHKAQAARDKQRKVLLLSPKIEGGNVAYRRALLSAVVIAATTVGILPALSGAQPLLLERERALKAKDVFKECEACPEMVVIPAGSFTMGSPASEPERHSSEGPQH